LDKDDLFNSLSKLGLRKSEAKIFFYLSKRGAKNASQIIQALEMQKQQFYPLINSLKNKGLVISTLDRPAIFSSVPIECALEVLTKTKVEEAKFLQENKEKLLSDWSLISQKNKQNLDPKFTVIKGRNYIFCKIQQMIKKTKSNFSIISNISDLFQLEQFGILDTIHKCSNEGARFRLITDITNHNLEAIKSVIKNINPNIELKGRNPDIGLSLFPKLALRDNEEILYFISSKPQNIPQNEYLAISTNCSSFVNPFFRLFEDIWNNSTNIDQKIRDIETGQRSPRTEILNNPNVAKKMYDEALQNAKKHVLFVTSPKSLNLFAKNVEMFKDWFDRRISVKIMSPITGENLDSAKKLSAFCEIKHVPSTYIETAIIDDKYLFQFTDSKNSIFYTSDPERVNKSIKMLNSIWKNSCNPSAISMNSLFNEPESQYQFKFHNNVQDVKIYNEKQKLTEKDVLNKIINSEVQSKEKPLKKFFACCCIGFALVHPPEFFKLPDVLICALHIDKKSSFGAEDALMVYLWLETPIGHKYVPFALVGDNPKGSIAWKTQMKGTPAENNIYLFGKDEIQIQVYGNTFFAEWKKPITLVPNKFTLPPSAILLEAYGKVRTHAYSTLSPAGVKSNWMMNNFEAFVTFMHKDSKYTGPGTDGLFIRDAYIETYF